MRASLLLALLGVVCPATAAADEVFAAHDAPLELGPASIDVELARFEARITVRYEVRNRGPLPDEATIELFTPPASAVTAMRYQPRAGAAWLDARLLHSDDASARWERYAEADFRGRRGPALVEMQADIPVLRLLLVPAGDRVAIEYTVVAPVCHAHGHWIAPSPELEARDGARYVVRGPRGEGARVRASAVAALGGKSAADACALSEPREAWSGEHVLVAPAPDVPVARGVDAHLVMVPAGDQRVIEVAIDTGTRLSAAPRDASVVFVVDASISMGAGGVAAQLAVMKAYLARSPGARFEIVVFRRDAATVFGGWRDGADVARALAAAGDGPFALGNGSNLDAGLVRAAAILARATGPRRIVAFTDDRVREALDEELARRALAGLPGDTVVHVVSTRDEPKAESVLERDLEHWLAPVAHAWGGIAATATLGPETESAGARAEVFEELVRPRRIDAVAIEEGHGATDDIGVIVEGESYRTLRVTASDAVTVRGMIWGKAWQPTLVANDRARRRVAALAVASGALGDLDADAVRGLAIQGKVVSEATSLWADDPRWTPGGLPPEVLLAPRGTPCGITSCGFGIGTTSRFPVRHGMVGKLGDRRDAPDLAGLLAAPVAACASRHGHATWSVDLEIETTGREIVDVRLLGGADDAAFARCVTESAWSLALGADYDRWTASFEVNVLGDRARR